MEHHIGHQRRIAVARETFMDGGEVPADDALRSDVVASWRRSVAIGIGAEAESVSCPGQPDFESRLVRCARPILRELSEQIVDIPVSIALSDELGNIIWRADSNNQIGRRLDDVCFAPGFSYHETSIGTNGVGTALESGGPLHIVGTEHFAEILEPFACAAAPIRDPFIGRTIGVLDVSSFVKHWTPMGKSIIRGAAQQIEHALLRDRGATKQAAFTEYLRADNFGREAVLVVSEDFVLANRKMRALLGPDDLEALQDHIRFVMGRGTTINEVMTFAMETRVRIRGSVIGTGSQNAGMVVRASEVRDSAHRDGNCSRMKRTPPIETPNLGTQTVPAPTKSAFSSSPAWRKAFEATSEALKAAEPLLMLGERGSGRLHLITRTHSAGEVRELLPEEIEADPQSAGKLVLEARNQGRILYVLRMVDTLSPSTLMILAETLSPSANNLQAFVATAGMDFARQPSNEAFIRLFTASTTLPPLRHRKSDLPALVDSLLSDIAPKRSCHVAQETMRMIVGYDWPGNVRQLKIALFQALNHRPVGNIQPLDMPAECQSARLGTLRLIDQSERDTIVEALRNAEGNRVHAAASLGIARSTLYRKIREYEITI